MELPMRLNLPRRKERKGDRQIMLNRLSVSEVVVGDVTDVN